MQTSNMHAIVLCAGLGTRLRPLTNAIPKPAVPVGPMPAALRNIEQLLSAGFGRVHCNTHYLAAELEKELISACHARGIPAERVRFWNEPELLETGGGIARIVRAMVDESSHPSIPDTIVVSGDIVADIPVRDMMNAWSSRDSNHSTLMVTLPLDRPRQDVTWVDETGRRVCGFGRDFDPATAASLHYTPRVFSNHQIISGSVLQRAPLEKKSSIDLFYRTALKLGENIVHVPLAADTTWFDIGTPETYLNCLRTLNQPLPDGLSDQSFKVINLLLPHPAQQTTEYAESKFNPWHDDAGTAERSLAQDCLSKIHLKGGWTWLGRLHSLPDSVLDGLTRLIASIDGGGKSARPSASLETLTWGLNRLPDSFLSTCFASSALAATPVSLSQGLLTAHIPSEFRSSLAFQSPLLVPLDFILGTGSLFLPHASHTLSPFWVLFIPQRL